MAVILLNKKELWQKFMQTGKVTDYLDYKNAKEVREDVFSQYDEETSDEFLADLERDFEEYEDDNQYGRFSDS